jgi:DNA-binding NarL/FixJ family response regulator
MELVVYSQSRSFEKHIKEVFDGEVTFRASLSPPVAGSGNVYLVHAPSFTKNLPIWLTAAKDKEVVIGVASDIPGVEDLLTYTEMGVKGYFNSYMAVHHYAQMLRLLSNGQSWYPPALISQAFDIARSTINQSPDTNLLANLTKRERQIAIAVAGGSANRQVASELSITERTVKAHLTQIFKKLNVKDRVALVIYLNRYNPIKSDTRITG